MTVTKKNLEKECNKFMYVEERKSRGRSKRDGWIN